jgi:hypothetical protein
MAPRRASTATRSGYLEAVSLSDAVAVRCRTETTRGLVALAIFLDSLDYVAALVPSVAISMNRK